MILHEPTFKVVRYSNAGYRDGAFELVDPLIFLWAAKRCVVTVRTGIVTNFASVPTGFRNVFPVNDKHRLPAVAHDYLYGCAGRIYVDQLVSVTGQFIPTKSKAAIFYTRAEADRIFYDLMLAENVRPSKAKMMYWAVRAFGASSYGGDHYE